MTNLIDKAVLQTTVKSGVNQAIVDTVHAVQRLTLTVQSTNDPNAVVDLEATLRAGIHRFSELLVEAVPIFLDSLSETQKQEYHAIALRRQSTIH